MSKQRIPKKRKPAPTKADKKFRRKAIEHFLQANADKEMTFKQIAEYFKAKNNTEKRALKKKLDDIQRQNKVQNESKEALVGTDKEIAIGIVDFASARQSFVVPIDAKDKSGDIRVPVDNMLQALHGDKVKVLYKPRKNDQPTGEIIEIIERATNQFTGVVKIDRHLIFALTSGRKMHTDIYLDKKDLNGAESGDKVLVEITEWKWNEKSPRGRVVRVLGKPGDHEAEMNSIMIEFGLPDDFDQEILQHSNKISDKITKSEIEKRRDFREIPTFTIDPLNAKDFDDALSFQEVDGNYEIGVHIADVTHYVKPNTVLEEEAQNRATSVYLVDRVIPMLPERLSNELCSLRPNEEKLVFSAVFTLTPDGKLLDEWFGRSIINSQRRFTYEEAQEIIEGADGDFKEEIIKLNNLAKILKEDRFQNGAISFESPEYYFQLSETGAPLGLTTKVRKDAHKLIEEFMLLANKRVATFVYTKQKPPLTMVYRVHEDPDPDKLEDFRKVADRFGYKFNPAKGVAKEINALTEQLEGKPEQSVLEQMAIRTMSKARYTTDPKGHYGLGFAHYSHFTSPIRRYPDMMVHRLLDRYLKGGKSADEDAYEEQCKHSSAMEKRASDAERASIKYKQAEYMKNFVDQELEGVVTGLTEWGLYVEATATHCEGMVRLQSIKDDHYVYDPEKMKITGRNTGRTFEFGDTVTVEIDQIDMDRRTVDLLLVE